MDPTNTGTEIYIKQYLHFIFALFDRFSVFAQQKLFCISAGNFLFLVAIIIGSCLLVISKRALFIEIRYFWLVRAVILCDLMMKVVTVFNNVQNSTVGSFFTHMFSVNWASNVIGIFVCFS